MKDYSDFGIKIPYGRTRGKLKTFCPQCHETRHNKTDKSLSVDLDKGLWNCHYCGWGGSLNESEFDDSPEGKRRWMEKQPWFRPAEIRREKPVYKKPAPHALTGLSERAQAWFTSRGISPQTVQALKISEGMEWMPQKQGQANTVQFNYFKDGELVNVKYRSGD